MARSSSKRAICGLADDREQGHLVTSTIPKRFSITRDGKSFRGTYSLNNDVVTVLYSGPNGVVREMAMATEGLKAITVARSILRQLA
jgi:hypothetical protein